MIFDLLVHFSFVVIWEVNNNHKKIKTVNQNYAIAKYFLYQIISMDFCFLFCFIFLCLEQKEFLLKSQHMYALTLKFLSVFL